MYFAGYLASYVALAPLGWLEPDESLNADLSPAFHGAAAFFSPDAAGVPFWWLSLLLLVSALGAGVGVMIVGSVGGQRTVNRYYVILAALVGALADVLVLATGVGGGISGISGGRDFSDSAAASSSSEMRSLRVLFPIIVWARTCEWVPAILHKYQHGHPAAAVAAAAGHARAAAAASLNGGSANAPSSSASAAAAAAAAAVTSLSSSSSAAAPGAAAAAAPGAASGAGSGCCDGLRRFLLVLLGVVGFWAHVTLFFYHYTPLPLDVASHASAEHGHYVPPPSERTRDFYSPEEEAYMGYFGFDYDARNTRRSALRLKDVVYNVRRSAFWRDATDHVAAFWRAARRDGFARAWDLVTPSMDLTGSDWAYETLELPRTATLADAKARRRQLALRWHPDKNPAESAEHCAEKFREVLEAYRIVEEQVAARDPDFEDEAEPAAAAPAPAATAPAGAGARAGARDEL
jgi:hypothetical protein